MTNEELLFCIQNDQNRQQNIEQLYLQNEGLLRKICIKLSKATGYEFEDLLQQSYFGLVRAVDTYKNDQKTVFATYATMIIKRELQRYINTTGSLIRKPEYRDTLIWKYKQFIADYQTQNKTDPFDSEICENLKINQKQLERIREDILTMKIKSFSERISFETEDTLGDTLPDPVDKYDEAERIILNDQLAIKLWDAVKTLKEQQQMIIKEIYANDSTVKEIAAKTDIPIHIVWRERDKALKELKENYQEELLMFLDVYGMGLRGVSLNFWKEKGFSSTEFAAIKLLERRKNEYIK